MHNHSRVRGNCKNTARANRLTWAEEYYLHWNVEFNGVSSRDAQKRHMTGEEHILQDSVTRFAVLCLKNIAVVGLDRRGNAESEYLLPS